MTVYNSRGNQVDIALIAIYNCFLQIKSIITIITTIRMKAIKMIKMVTTITTMKATTIMMKITTTVIVKNYYNDDHD